MRSSFATGLHGLIVRGIAILIGAILAFAAAATDTTTGSDDAHRSHGRTVARFRT